MFVQLWLQDEVRVNCARLTGLWHQAVRDALQAKYANRVLPKQGLCLAIEALGPDPLEPKLFPGDGAVHLTVSFSVLLFRPFIEEVIVGRIAHSDESGILVSLGFMQDIFVPNSNLPQPARFDETEKVWVWTYEDNDMFLDRQDMVRVRVVTILYEDRSEKISAEAFASGTCINRVTPMRIILILGIDGREWFRTYRLVDLISCIQLFFPIFEYESTQMAPDVWMARQWKGR